MTRRARVLGGVVFKCHEPGHWLGADGRLAILHLCRWSKWSEWHVFRTQPGKVPRRPFESAAFWGWHDLSYVSTLAELDAVVGDLRDRSRAMLPRLLPNETVVRRRHELRLVTGVHPDGDGVGAVLDVENYPPTLFDQWSTYGCSVVEDELLLPWPKR